MYESTPNILRHRHSLRRDGVEQVIQALLFFSALVSVVTTVGIVVVLFTEAIGFFREVSPLDFLFGTRWTPLLEPRSYGILPLLSGTMMVVVGSSVVALPIGVASAIYLSEYASSRMRNFLKPALEVLAGIPTVVYGYFAITFVTPALRLVFPDIQVFNAASASIVVGIMILPMVASLCDDALRAVPDDLRHGALALGATRMEVSLRVVLPGALSGVFASFVLALSRAIGETMAVTLAAGATPQLSWNFFESIQTMTAYIVQVSLGDTPAGTIEYKTIFVVGALLFLITLVMNVVAHRVLQRYREVYD
ncbi:MAG: phosphate ABC transporter permease subunit PstC [Acidobacteria bacterium]|nr:MAG: phosphate ABC transporter permease subunit PstC [Acidobacteriota bacterium]REJ99525.1 MAG: phosphate ABC transporter permease subunit PstC [Acidobacteriota bacterium]